MPHKSNDQISSTPVNNPVLDQYGKRLSGVIKDIHNKIPCHSENNVRTHIDLRKETMNGVEYNRTVLFLLSNPCEWSVNDSGGCFICGHLSKSNVVKQHYAPERIVDTFKLQFDAIDFSKSPVLSLFNNGSFLNPVEIPTEATLEIVKIINHNRDIKRLIIESRPEYIDENILKEIKLLIPDKKVTIAVGLETKNDLYRSLLINKGFTAARYEVAASVVKRYFNLKTYVFLKPPFLSEKESLDECIETIDYAFATGCDSVSLEGATVQDYTLTKVVYDLGLYRPPYLWSILEAVKKSKTQQDLTIGMFKFYPSPSKVPSNCEACNNTVMAAIEQYNRTFDARCFADIHCDCRKTWEYELEKNYDTLENRMEKFFELYQSQNKEK